MLKKSIYLSAIALAFSACYSDINLEEYRNDEIADMLVLNSIINPDSTVTVFASHPWFYTDYDFNGCGEAAIHKKLNVTDLDISIYSDGKEVDKMRYEEGKMCYTSNFKPSSGQQIEISTPYRGKTVTAKAVVPEMVEIEDIDITCRDEVYYNYEWSYEFTFHIKFSDKPGEKNYYFIDAPFDEATDYVFQQMGKDVTGFTIGWTPWTWKGLPFSDYGIDGKDYTLTLVAYYPKSHINYMIASGEGLWVTVKLYALSPEYYKYIIGIMANEDEDSFQGQIASLGIASPIPVESNIDGGLGILGCYTMSKRIVDICAYVNRPSLSYQ